MLYRLAAVLCFIAALVLSSAAKADTFTVYDFGTDSASEILGIDDRGAVLVERLTGAQDPYQVYRDGDLTSSTLSFPKAFVEDNGTPCRAPALPAGEASLGQPVCNGTREVYNLLTEDSPYGRPYEIYPGSDPLGQAAAGRGTVSELVLNGSGDFAYVDAENGSLREVIAVTPEPASLVLLATGLVCVAAAARRQWSVAVARRRMST